MGTSCWNLRRVFFLNQDGLSVNRSQRCRWHVLSSGRTFTSGPGSPKNTPDRSSCLLTVCAFRAKWRRSLPVTILMVDVVRRSTPRPNNVSDISLASGTRHSSSVKISPRVESGVHGAVVRDVLPDFSPELVTNRFRIGLKFCRTGCGSVDVQFEVQTPDLSPEQLTIGLPDDRLVSWQVGNFGRLCSLSRSMVWFHDCCQKSRYEL